MKISKCKQILAMTGALALPFVAPALSQAALLEYFSNFQTLNNSGVTGSAFLTLDNVKELLTVRIEARGLEANQVHPQHIHGNLGGLPSPIPTLACCDLDRDRHIEVLEGAKKYGPVLLNLTNPPGDHHNGFPKADANGNLNFSKTYDLNNPRTFDGLHPPLGANTDKRELFPLENRHIVLHGLTVADGVGAGTPGEVDGTGGYKAVLPVANGLISVAPEPASLALIGSGMLGLVWFGNRRRQDDSV